MAALAYLLLPVTGLAAYLLSNSPRMRMHGLQATRVGAAWPAAIYAGSAVSAAGARIAFAAGALTWIALLVGTALGKDPRLPVIGRHLERAAAEPPR